MSTVSLNRHHIKYIMGTNLCFQVLNYERIRWKWKKSREALPGFIKRFRNVRGNFIFRYEFDVEQHHFFLFPFGVETNIFTRFVDLFYLSFWEIQKVLHARIRRLNRGHHAILSFRRNFWHIYSFSRFWKAGRINLWPLKISRQRRFQHFPKTKNKKL